MPACGNLTRFFVTKAADVRSLTQHHCFATWDRVLVIIWRREVTPEGVDALSQIVKTFAENSKVPMSSLTIVESTSPPPNDKVRRPMSAVYRDAAPFMKEQIVVAEGSGFRSALVRSIGVALSAISPKTLPFKFASSIDEAAALVQPHLSASAGGAVGLKHALVELRQRLR